MLHRDRCGTGAILIGECRRAAGGDGRARDRGRITALTFSPEREPFVSWKNRAWFWAKLAEIPLARLTPGDNSSNMPRQSSDGIFGFDD